MKKHLIQISEGEGVHTLSNAIIITEFHFLVCSRSLNLNYYFCSSTHVTMLLINFALLLTLWQIDQSHSYDVGSCTAIVKKEGVEEYLDSIPIIVDGYKELVKLSQIFVDTTLFIETVLNTKSISLLLVGPTKWGKSVNADMLKTFLEIEVDQNGKEILPKRRANNYRLFKMGEITLLDGTVEKLENRLLISKEKEIMNQYLGQVPVVFIDFKDVKGDNFTAIKQGLAEAIGRAFRQHGYMINVLSKATPSRPSDLKDFEKYMNNGGSLARGGGIPLLCTLLYQHFGREPFVIIDNYDLPFINALGVRHLVKDAVGLEDLLKIMDSLTGYAFKSGSHVQKGVVFSSFQLEHPKAVRKWMNYDTHDLAVKEHRIAEFFGINEKDAQVLFDEHQIKDKLARDAGKWLNGYTSLLSGYGFYHPFFLINFIQVKKLPTYWKMSDQDEHIIHKYIESRKNKTNQILQLLSKTPIKVSEDAIMGKMELAYYDNFTTNNTFKEISWYLFRRGYLYGEFSQDSSNKDFYIKIPNNQIRFIMANWMICYYREKFQVADKFIQYGTDKIFEFVRNALKTITYLERGMENLYKAIAAYRHTLKKLKMDSRFLKKSIVLPEMFYYLTLKMQCLSLFEFDVYYEKTLGPQLVIVNRKTRDATVMEFECTDRPVEEVLQEALSYERTLFLEMEKIDVMQFVGVSLTSRKSIKIARKIIKRA